MLCHPDCDTGTSLKKPFGWDLDMNWKIVCLNIRTTVQMPLEKKVESVSYKTDTQHVQSKG